MKAKYFIYNCGFPDFAFFSSYCFKQAEEEFSKAQNVFEEINNELREELPNLYQRYRSKSPSLCRIIERVSFGLT